MKSLNLLFLAAVAAILRKSISDAFTLPLRFSSRTNPSSSSSSSFHTDDNSPSNLVVMKSSQYNSGASSTPTPNDEIIREEYAKWRRKYSKGDFDPVRSQNFKANFLAVTARNNMESNRARQNGQTAPSPIQLNEYGDSSAKEYRQASKQSNNSPRSMNSSPTRTSPTRSRTPTQSSNVGLNPSNTIINSSSANPRSRNSGMGREELSRATSQLRSVVEERRSLESELAQLKQQFEGKKKLLQNAAIEEQLCNERLALREEQKRLLNDRLANGWEDEGNQRRM
ncbi:MAG: hypothetical protein ACI90V_002109 [Bacillariaceae sp.]|jgi:hypothetical protein